jgi:hypothetical protein
MRKHTNDRLQGTLDLLVLKTLASSGRMHGYGITLHIEKTSGEILRLEEGSLYPALHRMTQSCVPSGASQKIIAAPAITPYRLWVESNWQTKKRVGLP